MRAAVHDELLPARPRYAVHGPRWTGDGRGAVPRNERGRRVLVRPERLLLARPVPRGRRGGVLRDDDGPGDAALDVVGALTARSVRGGTLCRSGRSGRARWPGAPLTHGERARRPPPGTLPAWSPPGAPRSRRRRGRSSRARSPGRWRRR